MCVCVSVKRMKKNNKNVCFYERLKISNLGYISPIILKKNTHTFKYVNPYN